MARLFKRLAPIIVDVKWDLVAFLLFVPLVSQSISRYLGAEPILHRLGGFREPLIEMLLLAGIAVFMSIRGAERLRTIERLQATEARYRGVVEDQTELICRFLPDWTLTFVNEAYCRYFGKQREELVGKSFMPLVSPEDRRELVRKLSELGPESPFSTLEHRVVSRGEFRWLRCTGRAILDADGTVVELQAVGRDVTEQKWIELERERLIQELEARSSDLEMLNFTISHDLKSPLITVRGLLGWVERDALSGNLARLKANMRVIATATARMEEMIDQVSHFVRIGQSGEDTEELEFSHVVREATDLVSGRIAENGVEVRIAANLPTIRANRSLLLQVLQNLLENSIKFMGDQPCPKIEIGSRLESGGTVLYVRDNGVGIDPSGQQKVFDLFSRMNDRSIEGSGLGLALVKRALEVQGGRIWVESEGSGQGSTFCFSLPSSNHGKRAI
jgi:PAS domain S-box-containing protein